MPFEIGRAFSPEVLASLDRNRDRAAANPGRTRRSERPVTDLQEAMLRAAQQDRESELRAQVEREGMGLNRERWNADREARTGVDLLDLERRTAADTATGEHRSALLGVREQEGADRAGRYEARSGYERGVLKVREQEAEVAAQRVEQAKEEAGHRRAMDSAKDYRSALEVVRRLRDSAFHPNKDTGAIDPERVARYADLLRKAGAMFTHSPEAGGRQISGSPKIAAEVGKALQELAATQGLPGVTEGDGPDGLLDVAMDEDDGLGG